MSKAEIYKITEGLDQGATLQRLLESNPFLQPVTQELDKVGELAHGMRVAAVYEDSVGALVNLGVVDEYVASYLRLGIGGVLLHDIGKTAINPGGIVTSLNTMSANLNGNSKNGADTRTALQREMQHIHPLMGGFILLKLLELGVFPKENEDVIKLWSAIAFAHHESIAGNNHRTRPKVFYPRSNSINHRISPERALVVVLAQLCDTAMAMREVRSYRKIPISIVDVGHELESLLNDDILKNILPLTDNWQPNEQSLTKLRLLMVIQIMKSVLKIELSMHENRIDKDTNQIHRINHSEHETLSHLKNDEDAQLACPILHEAIRQVWEEQSDRLNIQIATRLKEEHFHLSRE
jgi:hypothetical protein